MDDGFHGSQEVVYRLMKPILNSLSRALCKKRCDESKLVVRKIMHPRQRIHELVGGLVNIKILREDMFSNQENLCSCPIWNGDILGVVTNYGTSYIGLVESYGIGLFGVRDRSAYVAQNRACDMTLELFEERPELLKKLTMLPTIIQKPKVSSRT